jgi:hypothetical protein
MTRLSIGTLGMTAALGATLLVAQATPASAQCATCPQPVVAFSPVVAAPVVTQPVVVQQQVVRTGWYPGYWIDRMRMRRWDAATTTVVAATPTVTTANFAPTATWVQPTVTTVNRPVITAFAPLQPAVQTTFMPVISTPVASACSSCPQPVTAAFAPTTTVLRPVEVAPVVQTVVAAPACSACSVEAPCGGCSACSAGTVSQASFTAAAPVAADCPSCAATSSPVQYYGGSTSSPSASSGAAGPETPQPQLEGNVPTPAEPSYPGASSAQKPESSVVDPKPEADDAAGPEAEPKADPSTDASTSYDFQAPPLVAPQNDRTANRPTVDVHNAVYRQPVHHGRVSTTAAKVSTASQSTPATDANGWYSVSERE